MRTVERPERPNLSTPELDVLGRSQAELMSELWILRDRVLVLEHILTEAGLLTDGQIDDFAPSPELTKILDKDRDAFVARIVGAGHRQSYSVDGLRREAAAERTDTATEVSG